MKCRKRSYREGHSYLFLIGASSNAFELTSVIAARYGCAIMQKPLHGGAECGGNNGVLTHGKVQSVFFC